MSSERKTHLAPKEYLALERKADVRGEYLDGDMVAMSGGSREHNLIVTNIVRELSSQLKRKPCEVYPSNMRVKVSATGLYTYPDVVVVCDDPRFEDAHIDTLLNPAVIFEVLSDSTESYDRGAKFGHYRKILSLVCTCSSRNTTIQSSSMSGKPMDPGCARKLAASKASFTSRPSRAASTLPRSTTRSRCRAEPAAIRG